MNKGITVFLITILIVGTLPFAFAKNDNSGNERLVKLEQLKGKIQEKQQLTAEQKTAIRNALITAKQNYEENKAQFQEKQEKILKIKDEWQDCKNSDEEVCEEIKNEFLGYGKNYIINAADILLNYLEQLYNNIELSDMNEEEKEEALAEVQEQMDAVEAAKLKAESAETKEEIRDSLDELKNLLNKYKLKIKNRVTNLFRYKVGEIIVRAEQLEIKLERLLARAEESGYDTDELNNLIDEFNFLVESARNNYYEAKEILDEFHSKSPDSNKVQEAHDLLKLAHQDLSAAQKILRDILHEIKGISEEFINDTETCWENRPDYMPGYDLGYFIWQGNCENIWHVDWSGDMKENNESEGYNMSGTITTNGEFVNMGANAFDYFDSFEWSENTITFEAWVGPHFDGIHFQSTGTEIEFNLYVDGEYRTDLVYIGKDRENPSEIPFTLEGEVVIIEDIELVCEEGYVLYKGECIKEIDEWEIQELNLVSGKRKAYELVLTEI